MIVGRIVKTPFEEIDSSVDFTDRVTNGATITLSSVTAADEQGSDVTSSIISSAPAPSLSGLLVLFRVIGGVIGATYYVSIKVTSSDGQEFEAGVALVVSLQ